MKESPNSSSTNDSNLPSPIELAIVHGQESGLIKATQTELQFNDDISYEQWREILRFVQTARKKAAIYIADCISFGVKKFGRKKVDDALEQLELEATLVKAAIAIGALPIQLRFGNLDGDHYVELIKSGLPRAQKIRWARIASEQGLTPSQLRFSMIEGEVVDKAAAKALQTGVITIQGIRQSFDIWSRRVGGIAGVQAMELEDQIEIMEELDAICEFGMMLHEHLAKTQETKAQAG
jgi:hypothetical protein